MSKETQALESLLDSLEAGVIAARTILRGPNGPSESSATSWNPDKIRWESTNGQKGEYQRSQDVNNPEFKALVKDLAAHDGKITRNGLFYWLFQSGSTVGRKKAKYQKKTR